MKTLRFALAASLLTCAGPALAFDLGPFRSYLQYVAGSGDVPASLIAYRDTPYRAYYVDEAWLANPQGLFDVGYNWGNRRSLNPYYSTANRDLLREVAVKLGLPAHAADRAALEVAEAHFQALRQGYSDACSAGVIGNAIAARIFAAAGRPYEGLAKDETDRLVAAAAERQRRVKQTDRLGEEELTYQELLELHREDPAPLRMAIRKAGVPI